MTIAPRCRLCDAGLARTFVDLGTMPLANSYLEEPDGPEVAYPLHARVCDRCLLVQVDDVVAPQTIFRDYAYFSSYSDSWLRHARSFASLATARLGLGPQSRVIEIASNDGYLLRPFSELGVSVLGIEPAENVAAVAIERGIETICEFFGLELAQSLRDDGVVADLVVANNVLAHVPDLNSFVAGLGAVLGERGVVSVEVPHLLRLIESIAFDTIYHEHFSYFSLLAAQRLFSSHGLRIFDVEELPTHGGSLRLWATLDSSPQVDSADVESVIHREREAGLHTSEPYDAFADRVRRCRDEFVAFLADETDAGHSVVGYGAAAKGNTFLNYCGLTAADIPFVADRSPHKQGRFLPGSRIPVVSPERLLEERPDRVLILAWNLFDEIRSQLSAVEEAGGRFVIAVPGTRLVS